MNRLGAERVGSYDSLKGAGFPNISARRELDGHARYLYPAPDNVTLQTEALAAREPHVNM